MDVVETTELPPAPQEDVHISKAALTPPTSEDMDKKDDSSDLSDLDDEKDDDWEIEPDHYWGEGKVPVFKPNMDQFRSFKKFIDKIDKYGMKSGIVKVIPPPEWRESLPDLTDAVKTIKVKNPIMQEFAGQYGTYTQANIEKQRSYNLPQWKSLTEEHNHQPPAKRGERRRGEPAPKARPTRSQATSSATTPTDGPKRRPGRPRRGGAKEIKEDEKSIEGSPEVEGSQLQVPPTPTSPETKPATSARSTKSKRVKKEKDPEDTPTKGRQPKSISSRRMNNRRDVADYVDEEAFQDFDYHLENLDEFTPERCAELEENYWRTLNYGQPMYGADMPGSLFDDTTTSWNVAKLENLLDVLGTKVPGVNTAYLYLGMWKATFAWHLEDVDLYSINYIHFGAPKQWYSISQVDARKFENAMRSIWPRDAKNCSQFLRHKTYLISPSQLEKQFNIKVNRLVHYEGEFVITFPYGYHSGFNIGYNCAESVNFATEAWLNYGRIAKKCDCESDSVWVDVAEVERKLRGEPTPEYIEETDSEDDEDTVQDLPSPPSSVSGKSRAQPKKRKRDPKGKDGPGPKKKKLRLRIKVPSKEPCILCPNDVIFDDLLPTDNGQKAHRTCALYTLETYITEAPEEKVINIAGIDKARLELKCNFCRSKRGSCFQCDSKKCTRAYHATCALAAGVQIDTGNMPYFDDDGQEYYYEGTDFRCRFHRPKRPKTTDSDSLESNKFVAEYAKGLKPKDVVQAQYFTGDVFAGTVVENRIGESTVLLDILPTGDRVEVEHKYLLALDPAESLRAKPSSNAKPLPAHLTNNNAELSEKSRPEGVPEKGDSFLDPNALHKWEEFHRCEEWERNRFQVDVNFAKADQLWHYLGKTSTEAKAQYTEDPSKPRFNVKSSFLDTVKPPPMAPQLIHNKYAPPKPRQSYGASYPTGTNVNALNGAMVAQRQNAQGQQRGTYVCKAQNPPRPNGTSVYTQPLPFNRQQQRPVYSLQPKQPYVRTDITAPPPHHEYRAGLQQARSPTAMSPTSSSRPSFPDKLPQLNVSKSESPYQYWHIYYQPRSSEINNYLKNPYQFPSNSPDLQRRILAPPPGAPGAPTAPFAGSGTPASSYLPANTTMEEYLTHLKKYPYLLNCYFRRPKSYVSPYAPSGGFTPEWQPLRVNDRTFYDSARPQHIYTSPYGRAPIRPGSSSSSSSHTPAALQPPSARPSARPSALLFQTPQQFQQDVARGQAHLQSNPSFDKLIHKLSNPGAHPSTPGSQAVHGAHGDPQPQISSWSYSPYAPPPHHPAPNAGGGGAGAGYPYWPPGKQQQTTQTQQQRGSPHEPHEPFHRGPDTAGGQMMTPQRPIPAPLSEGNGKANGSGSPVRPEYSPLSDSGGGGVGGGGPPSRMQGAMAETWRFV